MCTSDQSVGGQKKAKTKQNQKKKKCMRYADTNSLAESAIQTSGSLIGNVVGILVLRISGAWGGASASVELIVDVSGTVAPESTESGSLTDDVPGALLSGTGSLDSDCKGVLVGAGVDSD